MIDAARCGFSPDAIAGIGKELSIFAEFLLEQGFDSLQRGPGVGPLSSDLQESPGFRLEPFQAAGATRADFFVAVGNRDRGKELDGGFGQHH